MSSQRGQAKRVIRGQWEGGYKRPMGWDIRGQRGDIRGQRRPFKSTFMTAEI